MRKRYVKQCYAVNLPLVASLPSRPAPFPNTRPIRRLLAGTPTILHELDYHGRLSHDDDRSPSAITETLTYRISQF